MKTRLILKPGQRGTKRLTDKYGDDLVCVRYRYDAETRQRLKTIELVLERTPWEPPPEKFSADTVLALRIEGYETEQRKKVKAAGGNGIRKSVSGTSDMAQLREQNWKSIYMYIHKDKWTVRTHAVRLTKA
ncbi:hypothetical protein [Geobacter benzoatilyticus]|jgi:hypothetical protein|uniref:hypothetical protein n=1 Tax=Geobacter benzoatilyticus TaxID=2815309 RepID=UPI001F4C3BB4|nr:hypothetical protein [Geobacter benzoatilyticus]